MFLLVVESFMVKRWKAMQVFFKSFGCSTNLADGEVLAGCLAAGGYDLVKSATTADVIIYNTCAVGVIHVVTQDFLFWVCIREIEQMLHFESQSMDGRVANGPNGTNVHMSLPIQGCSFGGPHFAIGVDNVALELANSAGLIRLSLWDVARVMQDKRDGFRVPRRIWMRGRAL
jgi:hypothetical protein